MSAFCSSCQTRVFVRDEAEAQWWYLMHHRIVHERLSVTIIGDHGCTTVRGGRVAYP